MKNIIYAISLFALGLLASEVSHHFLREPVTIEMGDAALTMGKTNYPSEYGFSDSVYIVMDKESAKDDASIVLREAGNARAEIGLVADNNIHIKTVTGRYGSEIFVDRFLVRSSGEVDAVGKIFRQYASSGTPTIAIGDSNGKTSGSGLELTYNHEKQVAGISSISRDIAYRPLSLSADSFSFHTGLVHVNEDPAIQILSEGQLSIYNGLVFSRNKTFKGGGFFPASLHLDETSGLVLNGGQGTRGDFLLTNSKGDEVFKVENGSTDVEFQGNLTTRGMAGVGVFDLSNLPVPQEGGVIMVRIASGSTILAYSDGTAWRRSDTLAVLSP